MLEEQLQLETLSLARRVDLCRWLPHILDHLPRQSSFSTHLAKLPRFQRDAAERILGLLARFGGALLCDEVGLGKTYLTTALVKARPADWNPVLIAPPACLIPQWSCHLGGDPNISILSHTKLALDRLPLDSHYRLIVIDEAHRFRNHLTRRYQTLSRLALHAKLLLITATPIHNKCEDVVHLLRLFLPSDAALSANDHSSVRRWLDRLMIRRSYWTLSAVYGPSAGLDQLRLSSPPKRREVTLRGELTPPQIDLVRQLPALAAASFPEATDSATSSIIETLLLKRFESSPAALEATLSRLLNYLARARQADQCGALLTRKRFQTLFGTNPDTQMAQMVLPFFFDQPNPSAHQRPPAERLNQAISIIENALARLRRLDSDHDWKLLALRRMLDQPDNHKTLIMTSYEDTARYLYRRLNIEGSALLTGSRAVSRKLGALSRQNLLELFTRSSQAARNQTRSHEHIRILIATDVLSEGLNLQLARRLIHYDKPYNPMALEQRNGRIARLASPHSSVTVVDFAIPSPIEERLTLQRILHNKRLLVSSLLTAPSLFESEKRSLPPATQLIGVDFDGFLRACAARLGTSDSKEPCWSVLPSEVDGFLIAYGVEERIEFELVLERHTSDSASILLELFEASLRNGEAEQKEVLIPEELPATLEKSIQRRVRNALWAQIEPRRLELNSLNLPLERVLYRNYVMGQLEQLEQAADDLTAISRLGAAPVRYLGHRKVETISIGNKPPKTAPTNHNLFAPTENHAPNSFSHTQPYKILGWLILRT